ncbi:hypothetical protein GCM10017562_52330 [Streptomyces roseofulvus]|uniref:hypothetical protein n=1 Tax=Streptomyces roseofulvus TaxID=33902 RepID=UPI0031FC700F
MIAGIGLCAFGVFGLVWGAMLAFNLRGTAHRLAARAKEMRMLTRARTGDLGLAGPSSPGAGYFRLRGAVLLVGSPALVLVGIVVTFD